MNFKNAVHIRNIIWVDGALLSEVMFKDKTYFVKWVDCDNHHNTWLIFEVSLASRELYYTKKLSLREIEGETRAAFILDGCIDRDEAAWTDMVNVPECWRATADSHFDESLEHG